ncbi:uridine phosphorylase [Vibrio sp. SCSIO 43137]|uniref:uridine phosphorylase n=1 Tax=Vibrio sp. SCSIO 43137 TaxID=3021011 RepID=UPI0023076050|nr:uridine phosphorylase [Vibrio sp. SCSIO 43137]WCE31784.1 uridine phosphorylase [Vibrio sp. SCSIO 43137]
MLEKVFHLGISKEDLKGATIAIISGDPNRVDRIAKELSAPVQLAKSREFNVYLCYLDQTPVAVCSTGIGVPSTTIAVEELAQCGIDTFLRIGTTGAIQEHIDVGSMIVTTSSVRLDGVRLHFCPMAFPAVADFKVATAMQSAAEMCGIKSYAGVTASSDTFYLGQERTEKFNDRIRRSLQNSMQEWREMGVLNFEMESATLLAMCASSGFRAGCLAGVIVNRCKTDTPSDSATEQVEQDSIRVIIQSARNIIT